MKESVYYLDRIEGETGFESSVFVSETSCPRILILPLDRTKKLSDGEIREGLLCRITFGDDSEILRIVPDAAKTEAEKNKNSDLLHSLFDRKK